MKVQIFTLFPEITNNFLTSSILGRALEKKIWQLEIIDIRDFGLGKHRQVDDYVYGGAAGMLMRPDVLGNALEAKINFSNTKIFYPSPKGEILTQQMAVYLAEEISQEESQWKNIAFICGRFEGIDQRILDEYQIEEISIGQYVISNGDLASCVILDTILRNIPGVLAEESLKNESFSCDKNSPFFAKKECPQYTKPRIWKNREVPKILLSGNHQAIEDWRVSNTKTHL